MSNYKNLYYNSFKFSVLILYCYFTAFVYTGCEKTNDNQINSNWDIIKADAKPYIAIPSEFGVPNRQALATSGWEDGLEISKDGLYLFCIYVPGDLFSWTLKSSDPSKFTPYARGPDYGVDLVTNPAGQSSWVQADILYAHRKTTNEEFTTWMPTNMARAIFSEGAPDPFENKGFVYTCNDKPPTYDVDIWYISGYPNPSGIGAPLKGFPHSTYTEDNPHIERISTDTLILFFDSDNYPNGKGSNDIWYSISTNDGTSWSLPVNDISINSAGKEHQPYLFKDKLGVWFLYFSADNTDGKLAIFRTRQIKPYDWKNWSEKELIIGAGNTAGVGEPSLTQNGNISFVAVYENMNGSQYDKYDCDPWFLPRK